MSRTHDLYVLSDRRRSGSSTRGRFRRLDPGWSVVRAGRRISHHRTQKSAIAAACRIARRARVDLVIWGVEGRIRSKDSYGNESPRRDKEH